LAHRHNVGLISVPAGRFVAAAFLRYRKHLLLLTLRFRTENIRCAAGSRANRCLLCESVSAT